MPVKTIEYSTDIPFSKIEADFDSTLSPMDGVCQLFLFNGWIEGYEAYQFHSQGPNRYPLKLERGKWVFIVPDEAECRDAIFAKLTKLDAKIETLEIDKEVNEFMNKSTQTASTFWTTPGLIFLGVVLCVVASASVYTFKKHN